MSNVPLAASTRPAHRRWPVAIRAAAPNVNTVPAIVIWFGVIGSRARSVASRWALRLTHAWKRVVNTRLDLPLVSVDAARAPGQPRLPIDLDDPRGHARPRIAR